VDRSTAHLSKSKSSRPARFGGFDFSLVQFSAKMIVQKSFMRQAREESDSFDQP
jgi:hypothetical protein